MGARGLALAFSITSIMDMTALLFLLRRKIGPLSVRNMIASALKISTAALVMGVSASIYFGITKLLKMEEVDVLLGIILKRFKRNEAAA